MAGYLCIELDRQMRWQDTQFDTSEETRTIQKVRDVQWAILLVCVAIALSYFV